MRKFSLTIFAVFGLVMLCTSQSRAGSAGTGPAKQIKQAAQNALGKLFHHAAASADAYYTLCRYQGWQGGHPVMYVTPIIHTNVNIGKITDAFRNYMRATYDVYKIQSASGYCQTVSFSADQQAYSMQQLEKQWADSKTVVTHINWTGTPAEIAAGNAKLAAAATAPGSAAPNQHYVYCGGSTGSVDYFSDIFAAVPTSATSGPHSGWNGFPEFSGPFLAFLQKKYGFKSNPNSPPACRIQNPNPVALHVLQSVKQAAEDQARQANRKVVETGWKGKP